MEKEILEQIKKDVEDIKEIVETNFSEMSYLEEIPSVQRYIRLSRLKYELEHGLNLKTEEAIFKHEYWKYTQGCVQETNDIWFLMGLYDSKRCYENFQRVIAKNYSVLVYINIENEHMKMFVDQSEQDNFESSHKVIYPSEQYGWLEYIKIREEYFRDCITENQEIAVQKVMSSYSKNRNQ